MSLIKQNCAGDVDRCITKHSTFGDILFLFLGYHRASAPARLVKDVKFDMTVNLKGKQFELACVFDVIEPGHVTTSCRRSDMMNGVNMTTTKAQQYR